MGSNSSTIVAQHFRASILWITKHFHKRTKRHNIVHVHVWLGTCDITKKANGFIELRYEKTEVLLSYLKDKFEDIILAILESRKKHKPTISLLEVPHYSLVLYNRSQKHEDPQSFYEADLKLAKQIDAVNQLIQKFNSDLATRSPKFSLHLTRPTKGHKKGKGTNAHSHYNFKDVYIDGIHPSPLLAKLCTTYRKTNHSRLLC